MVPTGLSRNLRSRPRRRNGNSAPLRNHGADLHAGTPAGGSGRDPGPVVPVMEGPLGSRSRPRATASRPCRIGPPLPGLWRLPSEQRAPEILPRREFAAPQQRPRPPACTATTALHDGAREGWSRGGGQAVGHCPSEQARAAAAASRPEFPALPFSRFPAAAAPQRYRESGSAQRGLRMPSPGRRREQELEAARRAPPARAWFDENRRVGRRRGCGRSAGAETARPPGRRAMALESHRLQRHRLPERRRRPQGRHREAGQKPGVARDRSASGEGA